MRNLKALIFVMATLICGAAAAEAKIAVVDLGTAIFSSKTAQQRQEELRAESDYASLQAQFDSTKADIESLQKDAEGKRMTWSEEQKQDFQKRMEYLQADLELTGRKLEQEVRDLQNKIVRELQPKALEALQELVEEENVTILLRSDAVLMANPELNLTERVTQRLNQKTQQ